MGLDGAIEGTCDQPGEQASCKEIASAVGPDFMASCYTMLGLDLGLLLGIGPSIRPKNWISIRAL